MSNNKFQLNKNNLNIKKNNNSGNSPTPTRNRTLSTNNVQDKSSTNVTTTLRRGFKPRRSEPVSSDLLKKSSLSNINSDHLTPSKQFPIKQQTPLRQTLMNDNKQSHVPISNSGGSASVIHTPINNNSSATNNMPANNTPANDTPANNNTPSSNSNVNSPNISNNDYDINSPIQILSPQPPSPLSPNSPSDDRTQSKTLATFSLHDNGWELETEENDPTTLDEDFQKTLHLLSFQHSSTITSYKRLLESSQSSSAAQLYALQADLKDVKHANSNLEKENRNLKSSRKASGDNINEDFTNMIKTNFDEIKVKKAIKNLDQSERLRLIRVVLESSLPHDISTTIKMLEKYAETSFDVLATLPIEISTNILSYLNVNEALDVSLVSKDWYSIVHHPKLWQHFVNNLTSSDPDPTEPPSDDNDWENLYRALHFRERNWTHGLAQSIKFLNGHSNYVTSMQLKGGTLVTGSYDETLRIWDMRNGGICKTILQAKAISCLDYLPNHKVLAAGYFDVGRVVVYSTLTNQPLQMLQGHNRGIKAVACNDDYLVSAGLDKALVAWNWRTGERIVRFGQQTSLNVGVQLIDVDKFVAVTVDSIIRCYSISKREMTAQYKLSSLSPEVSMVGTSNDTMLTWFGADGSRMTFATKNHLIHLEWEEGEEVAQNNNNPAPIIPASTNGKPRLSTGKGPRKSSSTLMIRKNSSDSTTDKSESNKNSNNSNNNISNPNNNKSNTNSNDSVKLRIAPVLTKPPKVLCVTPTDSMAVGATDVRKQRVVTATRFSSRPGADRRVSEI